MEKLMLATHWDTADDPTGWWLSEKLDGVRAYWDGTALYSRAGNRYTTPAWFREAIPNDIRLDGELWLGRGTFSDILSILRSRPRDRDWRRVTYQVFDSVSNAPFEQRLLDACSAVLGVGEQSCVQLLNQVQCKDRTHLNDFEHTVISSRGEGVILRQSGSLYEHKRSSMLRKLKRFLDAEAVVIGYNPSDKKERVYRSLHCRSIDGHVEFDVGSGLSDHEMSNPPALGTIITYGYQHLMESGKPRHPWFIREKFV